MRRRETAWLTSQKGDCLVACSTRLNIRILVILVFFNRYCITIPIKLNRQQNKDALYPRSQTPFLHSFVEVFQNAYVRNRDLGPFILLIASFPTKSTFPVPPFWVTSSPIALPPRPQREAIPVKNGISQNFKRPALRLFGSNKSLPLHLQHRQPPRLG